MPQERKSLIQPGSILPAADIMARVIERDRNKSGRPGIDTPIQEPGKAAIQEYRNAETHGTITEDGEPNSKATFDLPRSLYYAFKVQAAKEDRPGRAIIIELMTQYLESKTLGK